MPPRNPGVASRNPDQNLLLDPACQNRAQGAECAVLKLDRGGTYGRTIYRVAAEAGFRVVDSLGSPAYLFGVVAIGSPLLAAVAVNALIAWLIILAGVVHLVVAFHAHGAGSLIWKLLVGLAYIAFGGYLLLHPLLGVASLTLVLASLFLIEGVLDVVLYFNLRPARGAGMGALRWACDLAAGPASSASTGRPVQPGRLARWSA